MGGAHPLVDVQSVGRTANADHFSAQLVKYIGRDVIGRSVRGIHHDLQSLEGELVGTRTLAELNVTPGGIVQTPRLAQSGRVGPHRGFVQRCLNGHLPVVGQFGALCTEKLDPVVGKGVVACADHHTQTGALGAGQVGHRRCGHRPQQHHIDTRRVEPRLQRRFQHVPGDARVLAYQHGGTGFIALEHPAYRMGQAQDKVRRDRRLADRATDAIRAEVFASHEHCEAKTSILGRGRRGRQP